MLDFYRRPSTWLEGNPRSSSKVIWRPLVRSGCAYGLLSSWPRKRHRRSAPGLDYRRVLARTNCGDRKSLSVVVLVYDRVEQTFDAVVTPRLRRGGGRRAPKLAREGHSLDRNLTGRPDVGLQVAASHSFCTHSMFVARALCLMQLRCRHPVNRPTDYMRPIEKW